MLEGQLGIISLKALSVESNRNACGYRQYKRSSPQANSDIIKSLYNAQVLTCWDIV